MKTLHEGFHEIITSVRRLNIDAEAISAEASTNSTILQQKLRRLLTLNADTLDTLTTNKTLSGMGAYAGNELPGLNIGATSTSTQNAITTFRDYMIANLPAPADNGLDANGRSTNLQVTTTDMPALIAQVDALIAATEWA